MKQNKTASQNSIKGGGLHGQKKPPAGAPSIQRNTVTLRSQSPSTQIPARKGKSKNMNSQNNIQVNIDQANLLLQKGGNVQPKQPSNPKQIPKLEGNNTIGFEGLAQKLQHEEYPFDQINNLIHEYLLKNNLIKTLDAFQEELTQPLPPYDQSRGYEYQLMEHFKKGQRDLFFQKWNRFLPLSLLIGDEKVTKLEFYLQIFFFIFQIHPFFKRQSQVDQESVNFFKEYLDTRGAALSKTSEFLHYYALPYIPRPQEHQALKHLFTNQWIETVRFQLNEFLASIYDNQPLPLLFYVYQNYLHTHSGGTINNSISVDGKNPTLGRGLQQNLASPTLMSREFADQQQSRGGGSSQVNMSQLQSENRELVNVVKQFNEKYMMLQNQNKIVAEQNKQIIIESHQKWIVTANELVQISKSLKAMIDSNQKKGQPFQQETLNVLSSRIDKFESFLSTNLEDLISQSQDISLFDKASFLNDQENGASSDFLVSPAPLNLVGDFHFQGIAQDPLKYENPYCALDFQKIKSLIIKQEDPILCCAVLQALRWRVSKARGAYVRREIVVAYSTFDIIGCEIPEDQPLQIALFQRDLRIQEFALRLINAMASDFYGRTYLIKSNNLAIILIDILRKEKEDSFTRRNALGALQKLSLRRKPQIVMINNHLIQWIVKTLREEKDTLSEYSYEYATALFMNLSLRSSGKLKCEDPKEGVLNVLNDLLEHENMQVRTFVNGTLYSLLGRQQLREQARAMGMNEILSYLMESSDERFTKQIQYIMDQLNKEKPDDDALSDSNEEDNDVDDIDDEEEIGEDEQVDDFIENANNVPLGEDLLVTEFRLEGEEAKQQQNITKKIIQDSHHQRMISSANTNINQSYIGYQRGTSDIPFNRPATPSMSTSFISHSQKTSQTYRPLPSQQQQRVHSDNTENRQLQGQAQRQISANHNSNNLNYYNDHAQNNYEQSRSHPQKNKNNQQQQEESNEEEDQTRNLPSEMRSRPKILRTPAGGERQRIEQLQRQHEHLQQQTYTEQAHTYPVVKKDKPKTQGRQDLDSPQKPPPPPPEKLANSPPKPPLSQKSITNNIPADKLADQVQVDQAFEAKPKIPRTPPGLQK